MGDAISVCPFYFSRADITPSEYVPFWWAFFPPPREKLRKVYELGYRDALNWLKEHQQVPLGELPLCQPWHYLCITGLAMMHLAFACSVTSKALFSLGPL